MTLTFNLMPAMVMTHTNKQKSSWKVSWFKR